MGLDCRAAFVTVPWLSVPPCGSEPYTYRAFLSTLSSARELLGEVETAEVKQGVARHRALILPPAVAQDLIRQKARRAVERIGEVAPLRVQNPVEIKLRYTSTDLAEARPFDGEQIVRADGRTVLHEWKDILDALRLMLA